MARGGFISPAAFLKRAHARNIAIADARGAVVEALKLGTLICKARRHWGRLHDTEVVAIEVWSRLKERQIALWDWDRGHFHSTHEERTVWQLREVTLKEAQCNELLSRLEGRLPKPASDDSSPASKERRRGATWDEWVAVIATLAYEHSIDANSTDADILDRSARRLGIQHDREKQTKRWKSAALAIATEWKRHPPREPAPVRHDFADPTKKP